MKFGTNRRLRIEQLEEKKLLAGIVISTDGGGTGEGTTVPRGSIQDSPFQIEFLYGPEIDQLPQAKAILESAAEVWRSHIADPVTVFLRVDFTPLGPGILGGASPATESVRYDIVRDLLIADAQNEPVAQGAPAGQLDDEILLSLPEAEEMQFNIPAGATFNFETVDGSNIPGLDPTTIGVGTSEVNRATLKAIGHLNPLLENGEPNADYLLPDASIVFTTLGLGGANLTTGSNSVFDFDLLDGIDPNQYSFLDVAMHEIGHALGFASAAGGMDTIEPTPLDFLRFPRSLGVFNPGSAEQFGSFQRELRPDVATMTDFVTDYWTDGPTEIPMSDVFQGNQSSHWEEQAESLGIFDPIVGRGESQSLTLADLRALDLIGWDIVAPDQVPVLPAPALDNDQRLNPLDVNQNGTVTPSDALAVINSLNRTAEGEWAGLGASSSLRTDVNGDGQTGPIDALVILNYLNRVSFASLEVDDASEDEDEDETRIEALRQAFAEMD